jgi:hypothetical protein
LPLPFWIASGSAELPYVPGRAYDEFPDRFICGRNTMRIAHSGSLVLAAALLALTLPVISAWPVHAAPAQTGQSQDALAAAARRAREQQKAQPRASKVWDNDNIPTNGGVDVIGPAASTPPPASTSAPAAGDKASANKASAANAKKDTAVLETQLKAARETLKNAQTDLDFAQRKFKLDQQDFYQNPNYSSDTSGAAALKSEQTQIDAKKQAAQSAQDKVDDLEAKLAKASDTQSSSSDTSAK